MNKKEKDSLKTYIFWALIIILAVLAFMIIKSFIVYLLSAFILAYMIKPLYLKINKTLSNSNSAILCILIMVLAVIIPLAFIVTEVTQQVISIVQNKSILFDISTPLVNDFLSKLDLSSEELISNILSLMSKYIIPILSSIPDIIVGVLITILGMYYILINWESLSKQLEKYIPFANKEKIADEIGKTSKTIIYGSLLIGFIELIIAGVGFYISGVNAYLILSVIIFVLAFFPGGPIIVWLPTALVFFLEKEYYSVIGIVITGLIISILIDTLLRSKMLGSESKINPLIMLIGIIGGISIFGIFGFVIGPLILVYTIKILTESMKK